MATLNLFNCWVEDIGRKVHNLHTDTFKVMLTNTVPLAANTVPSDITDLSTGGGYTAGGATCGSQSYSQTSGVAKWLLGDVSWTGSGGGFGPFRYVVVYNSTATKLVGWYDRTASLTPLAGDTFTTDFDGTNGVLTIP